MTMESSDDQALGLLSTPKAITVRLQRRLTYSPRLEIRKEWDPAAVSYLGTAVWWSIPGEQGSHVRTLHGELQLSPQLKPSTEVLDFFSVKVRVHYIRDPFSNIVSHWCFSSIPSRSSLHRQFRSALSITLVSQSRRRAWRLVPSWLPVPSLEPMLQQARIHRSRNLLRRRVRARRLSQSLSQRR